MSDRPKKSKWVGALVLIVLLTAFWGMREQAVIRRSMTYDLISGQTMGTFYNIKLAYSGIHPGELAQLRSKIEAELRRIELSMSTYIPDSEISRFNAAPADDPMAISLEFRRVLARTLEFCELSGGAFDPTVGPLVNLWGFGNSGRRITEPEPDELAAAQALVGWHQIRISDSGNLSKETDGLQIGLGAIAKGYAVDRVAAVIAEFGIENYMVEIGGEVYAAGLNSAGEAWRIGIDTPVLSVVPAARLRGVASISNLAVATSGDYRNYFKDAGGVLRSHIIDPRTGSPVLMPTASVSVVAGDCMTADALATALFVMGVDEGLGLVERLDHVEALFIVSEPGGGYAEFASSGFSRLVNYELIGE